MKTITELSPGHMEYEDQCVDIIGKLWALLDVPGDHAEIVDLLSQFDLLKPKIFSDVIISDFGNEMSG